MKIKWDENTNGKTLSNIVVVAVGLVIYFVLKNASSALGTFRSVIGIVQPFIYGAIIAYLLNPLMCFIEARMLPILNKKKKRLSLTRMLSILLAYIIALVALASIVSIILPQLIQSVTTLILNFPSYMTSLTGMANELSSKLNIDPAILQQIYDTWGNITEEATRLLSTGLKVAVDFSVGFTMQVANVVVGLVVSAYFLAGKERFLAQIHKFLSAVFPVHFVEGGLKLGSMCNHTFSRYIFGQMLDAMVMGILCFICMTVIQIPFALLVSTIVMITNVIPFFGPFIGAVPSIFIILMVDPKKALWFAILILILQQIDGNILVPKIVGDSTGISAFWVLFAILLGGGLFGLVGIVVAVPVFSVIYAMIKAFTEVRLEQKGMVTETGAYYLQGDPLKKKDAAGASKGKKAEFISKLRGMGAQHGKSARQQGKTDPKQHKKETKQDE